jgi:ketosteroid isomerase-like protein
MAEWDNHQTVRRLFDAFESRNLTLLEEVLHEDFIQESRGLPEGVGDDTHPLSVMPLRILASGDAVVVLARWAFPGHEATGLSLFEFSDDKIFKQSDYFGEGMDASSEAEILPSGDDGENRVVAERFWRAMAQRDLNAIEKLRAEDFILEWPQSGERVRGREVARDIEETYEGQGVLLPRRIVGTGGFWVIEAMLMNDGDRSYIVSVLEIDDGKIIRQTDYFGDPFPAPEWRGPMVERMAE